MISYDNLKSRRWGRLANPNSPLLVSFYTWTACETPTFVHYTLSFPVSFRTPFDFYRLQFFLLFTTAIRPWIQLSLSWTSISCFGHLFPLPTVDGLQFLGLSWLFRSHILLYQRNLPHAQFLRPTKPLPSSFTFLIFPTREQPVERRLTFTCYSRQLNSLVWVFYSHHRANPVVAYAPAI